MLAGVGVVGAFSYNALAPTSRPIDSKIPTVNPALPEAPIVDVSEAGFRWVDVTAANFDSELKRFQQLLPEAFLVSVDTEFTGLEASEKNRSNWSDSIAQRYRKSRDNCSQFMALQIGVCLWTTNDKQEYVAYPFNFYVMPKDKNFLVQASSLRFLADNHYDFNKTFGEGIPFLNLDEESQRKDKVLIRTYDKITIGPKEEILLNDLVKQISDWRDSATTGEVLEMPNLTGFQRLLAYQEVDQRFDDIYFDSKRTGPQVVLKVSKITKEEKENLNRQKVDAALKKIDEEVGFTKVMKSITEQSNQFVVVGHNMFLDLLHFYDKFYKRLPQELPEFVKETNQLFPQVMDTKYIAINDPGISDVVKTTDLGFLHQNIAKISANNAPKITIPSNFGQGSGSGVYHQAGFDAFITGYVYLHMLHTLGGNGFNRASMLAFAPYMNKVNVSMSRVPLDLRPVSKSEK
jgi:poly(A)-specific ribonuclease